MLVGKALLGLLLLTVGLLSAHRGIVRCLLMGKGIAIGGIGRDRPTGCILFGATAGFGGSLSFCQASVGSFLFSARLHQRVLSPSCGLGGCAIRRLFCLARLLLRLALATGGIAQPPFSLFLLLA